MSLADDWGVHGITVNCLAPGWFKTKQNAVMYENQEWVEYLCDRIPLKRPGQPQDLDGAVVFLASDASAYITGQTLLVDGGISTGATRALPKSGRRRHRLRPFGRASRHMPSPFHTRWRAWRLGTPVRVRRARPDPVARGKRSLRKAGLSCRPPRW